MIPFCFHCFYVSVSVCVREGDVGFGCRFRFFVSPFTQCMFVRVCFYPPRFFIYSFSPIFPFPSIIILLLLLISLSGCDRRRLARRIAAQSHVVQTPREFGADLDGVRQSVVAPRVSVRVAAAHSGSSFLQCHRLVSEMMMLVFSFACGYSFTIIHS